MDCISKGKAHKRYTFGAKVSVATTNTGGFLVGMRALPGNPYDGHTLGEARLRNLMSGNLDLA